MALDVYLDQNIWIELSKIYFGKINDKNLKETYTLFKKSIDNDDIKTYLSYSHIQETLKIKNNVKRDNLIEFMMEFSKGNTILPYFTMINLEIQNYFYDRIGLGFNLKNKPFGKGLPHLLGGKLELSYMDSYKLPPDIKKELLDSTESMEFMKLAFKDEKFLKLHQNSNNFDNGITKKFEFIRSENNKVIDKNLKRRLTLVKILSGTVVPELARLACKYQCDPKIMMNKWNEEDIMVFLKKLPTTYTDFILTYKRDANIGRDISSHDLYDIAAYSVAIPYCDIFVGEKMFTSFAINEKLNVQYNTKIISNLSNFRVMLQHISTSSQPDTSN